MENKKLEQILNNAKKVVMTGLLAATILYSPQLSYGASNGEITASWAHGAKLKREAEQRRINAVNQQRAAAAAKAVADKAAALTANNQKEVNVLKMGNVYSLGVFLDGELRTQFMNLDRVYKADLSLDVDGDGNLEQIKVREDRNPSMTLPYSVDISKNIGSTNVQTQTSTFDMYHRAGINIIYGNGKYELKQE